MPLLSATNIKYTIGTRVLLDGVSLTLEPGQRIGLVGRNGQGKTTLFKILCNRIQPDSGSVVLQRGCRAGYLTQDPELDLTKTLHEEATSGMQELANLHIELDQVFHDMSEPAAQDPVILERLLKRQDELQHRIDQLGGYAVEHKVDTILHGLGFTDAQFGVRVGGLSGGQKGRLALAKLLLENPDLLLLDEPTNHLDIAGREWLEEFLSTEFKGAVLVVSHDRYLLDRVVERIEEIENGRLIDYPGNYSAFREIRAQRLLTQHRAYENQQSEWAKEEEFIRRFKAGQRAKEAQGRLSKLERQKELFAIERPAELAGIHIRLPDAPRSGDHVVTVRDAAKAFTNTHDGQTVTRTLFKDLSLTISRGERWGIIGPNGAGKTTLVKCLLGQGELTGGFSKLGASVVIGYYSQLPPEEDADLPVFEYLQRAIKRENAQTVLSEQQARDLAGMFLFSGRDQDKRMGTLSGGERSRARLAALLASAKNLIVLDEPTNHLDIPSAERLEQALRLVKTEDGDHEGYEGTLLLISHDRWLIDATCDHLLVFDGEGNATVFHGNYSEYHRQQVEKQKAEAAAANAAKTRPQANTPASGSGKSETKTESRPENRNNEKAGGSNGSAKADAASRGTSAKPGASADTPASSNGAKSSQQTSNAKAPKGPKPNTGLAWMPLDRLEKELAKAEAAVKAADAKLADPKIYMDPDKCREALHERDKSGAELSRHETEWLYRMEG